MNASPLNPAPVEGYLLSYPRSGNHLTRVLVEFLTRRRTSSIYARGEDPRAISERAGIGGALGVDPELPPGFFKVHRMAHLEGRVDRTGKLILIVRDPFESIASDLPVASIVARVLGMWRREWETFLENLRSFEAWSPDTRHLVYYEDLLASPAEVLPALGRFLEAEPERTAEAISQFDDLRAHGLGILRRQARASNDPRFYWKRHLWRPRLRAPDDLAYLTARYASVDRRTS